MPGRSISPVETFGEYHPESDANLKEHVFCVTDTVSGLAYRYYGDWRLWRLIADRNKISDVRKIEPGTLLLIPEKPLEQGKFQSE